MKLYISLPFLFVFCLSFNASSQTEIDSVKIQKEYTSLDSALKSPADVYRLNLSSQSIEIADSIWPQFTNLEYLSLKDDHLTELPEGLGALKNLKILDLSGNDFKQLPSSFANLTQLEELYLNDEKYFQFDQSITLLSTLPSLKSLHVEGDGLTALPEDIYKLSHLESLYLNNNEFKQVPIELKGLENLQYVDFQDNKFTVPAQGGTNPGFGFKIRF